MKRRVEDVARKQRRALVPGAGAVATYGANLAKIGAGCAPRRWRPDWSAAGCGRGGHWVGIFGSFGKFLRNEFP